MTDKELDKRIEEKAKELESLCKKNERTFILLTSTPLIPNIHVYGESYELIKLFLMTLMLDENLSYIFERAFIIRKAQVGNGLE